jgi:hypothetical protein
MGQHAEDVPASQRDREVLEILLESDLYLELPLKERHQLFKHIVKAYLYPVKPGNC